MKFLRIFQTSTIRYARKSTQSSGSRKLAKNGASTLPTPSQSADDAITKWIASNTPWITQFQTEYGAGRLNVSELVSNLERLLDESPIPRGRELSLSSNKATQTKKLDIFWESKLTVLSRQSSDTKKQWNG